MEYSQKNVLLSIHTEYAMKIVDGEKTVELRRRFPLFKKEDKKKILIYACSPISKIIGECYLKEVKKQPLEELWNTVGKLAMIDYCSFKKYFNNCDFGFALYLEKPIKYKELIELTKIFGKNNRPPQSYRYISNNSIV